MELNENLSDRLERAWNSLNNGWQGEDAQSFYNKYIPQLLDNAQQFQNSSIKMNEQTDNFMKELEELEQKISNDDNNKEYNGE